MPYILMNRRSQRYYREPMPLKSQEVITLFDAAEKKKQQVDIMALGVTKLFTWFAYSDKEPPSEPLYYVKRRETEKSKRKTFWLDGNNYRVVVSESYKDEKLAKEPDNYEFIPVIKK